MLAGRGPPRGPPRGMPGRGPNGPKKTGPPPADLIAKAKAKLPPTQTPTPTTTTTAKTTSDDGATYQDQVKSADAVVKQMPKGKKKVQAYVHTIGIQLATAKAAHTKMEDELKKIKRERDEIREDFDALNDDFQNVRHDVAKAEKKAEDHLDNVKEMHGDNKEILDSNEALRTLTTIAFKGLIEIEDTMVVAAGPISVNSGKVDYEVVAQRKQSADDSLKNLRNLKIKLREALIAMNVDIFSQEEKDMMELVKSAGDDAGIAATKMQSQFRGKQAREEFKEKKEAANKIQSRIRGAQARKTVDKDKNDKNEAATKVQKIQRGNIARNDKGKEEKESTTTTTTAEKDGKQNAVNSRLLKKSQEEVKALKKQVQEQKNKLNILRNEIKQNGGVKGKKEKNPAKDPPLSFSDEVEEKEADDAAIKIQKRVRGKQTKETFEKKKDTLKYEKDRDSLVRKARRSEALETEVKRLRDKLVETTMNLDGAKDRGRKEARAEYEKELARRERSSTNKKNSQTNKNGSADGGVDIQMFEATAQELDMAQTKLSQTRSDLEQERKRNMRLHRLRMAAEEEIEKAKETLNILSQESERERQRSEEYERTIDDLKDDLRDANERIDQIQENDGNRNSNNQSLMVMGPNGQMQTQQTPNVQALMIQLRASEDGRMAALMEVQRSRAQIGFNQESNMDAKLEVEQMSDELSHAREVKRRSEMQVLEITEKLDLANMELRTNKRTIGGLKRRLAAVNDEKKRNSQNLFSGMNMLTADQQSSPNGMNGMGGMSGMGDGSGNPMMVQNMQNMMMQQQSPRSMVSMVGTMPQLPMGVLRVGNGPGFMQGGANNASLWQQPGGGPTIRTVPESDAMDQSQNGRGRQGNRRQNGNSNGYANIHSRDGGKGSKPQRPSPKKGKPSPTQRVIRPRGNNNNNNNGGGGGNNKRKGGAVRGSGYGRR